jgi:carboxylesterase
MQRGNPAPFFFQGGAHAVLCVHGFTGTPYEVRPLGEALHSAGFTVLGIRLPGHASPKEMELSSATEWKDAVVDGVAQLEKNPQVKGPVGIVGLSMGGALSLLTAANLGARIKAVAALATPVHLSPRLEKLIRGIQRAGIDRVLRFVPKIGGSDIGDVNARKENPTLHSTPVRSTYQLLALLTELEQKLSSVQQPLFLAHGAKDRTVPYANLDYVAQHVGSTDIEVRRFPRSHHVITLDIDREAVAKAVVNFFQAKLQ